jgi:hypothetical protein
MEKEQFNMKTGFNLAAAGVAVPLAMDWLGARREESKARSRANSQFRIFRVHGRADFYPERHPVHHVSVKSPSGSREFRRLPPKRKLVKSDQAANKPRALCDSNAPAMLQYYQHEATGATDAR